MWLTEAKAWSKGSLVFNSGMEVPEVYRKPGSRSIGGPWRLVLIFDRGFLREVTHNTWRSCMSRKAQRSFQAKSFRKMAEKGIYTEQFLFR